MCVIQTQSIVLKCVSNWGLNEGHRGCKGSTCAAAWRVDRAGLRCLRGDWVQSHHARGGGHSRSCPMQRTNLVDPGLISWLQPLAHAGWTCRRWCSCVHGAVDVCTFCMHTGRWRSVFRAKSSTVHISMGSGRPPGQCHRPRRGNTRLPNLTNAIMALKQTWQGLAPQPLKGLKRSRGGAIEALVPMQSGLQPALARHD